MRNSVQLWLVTDVDTSVPVVLGVFWFFSQAEARKYMEDNPLVAPEQYTGPVVYWFLLNKYNLATIIAQFPWVYQTDGTLLENNQVYTRDRGFAYGRLPAGGAPSSNPLGSQGWNVANDLFLSDEQDKWSVINRLTALNQLLQRAEGD